MAGHDCLVYKCDQCKALVFTLTRDISRNNEASDLITDN